MKKNKLGFTLGEVLVCMAIIGIIMALAAHTIKLAKSSYTAVTYHAFNNVKMMTGELIGGERIALNDDKSHLPMALATCTKGNSGMTATILAPDYRSKYTTPQCSVAGDPANNGGDGTFEPLFCKNIVYFSNTAGKTRCDKESDYLEVEFDETRNEPRIKESSMQDKWETPNFIATNGYRYYISKWTYNADVSNTYGFRIMAVDVNGTNGPNQLEYDPDTEVLPDIVQFLILDNGEVYPIGVAGSNVNIGTSTEPRTVLYLNARIKGYNFNDDVTRTNNIPTSCIVKNADGSTEKICNFSVVYLQLSADDSFFSYKEALCGSFEGTSNLTYTNYCTNYDGSTKYERSKLCPPSTEEQRVDECLVKLIKPVFRYNMK